MQTVTINENIRLHYIEMTKLKTTSAAVYIHRPLCAEEASYNALLPLVLKSGSNFVPSRGEIAKYLDNLYGASMGATVFKSGEDQMIYFDAETISDRYAPDGEKLLAGLLKLVMSLIFDPKAENGEFDATITAQEKINAIDKLEAVANDKRQYASLRCQQETARGTNFALQNLGTKDGIEQITPRSLYEHYSRIITSSPIDIYICGEADIESAERAIREYTDRMTFTAGAMPETEIVTRSGEPTNAVTEKMDVTQGKLAVGFLTNVKPDEADYFPLVVLNSVFGAGTHSKLFNNVREKLSLAYYASSMLLRAKGMIIVNAGIEFDNFDKAYREILAQLEEIKKGNVTEHEFESSITAIVNTLNGYYDDQRALATYYVTEELAKTRLDLSEYIEKIKAVTLDEVSKVSRKLTLDTVYFLTGKGEQK